MKKILKSPASLSIVLLVILLVANITLLPSMMQPQNIIATLALAAPLCLSAMAETIPILSGGGGIDISVGATMAFVNVSIFTWLPKMGITNGVAVIAASLLIGLAIGAINGIIVAVVRIQPMVATLGTELVLTGLCSHIMPRPSGTASPWMSSLSGFIGGIIPGPVIIVAIPFVIWLIIKKFNFYQTLMAVGGDERAAYSAGLPVTSTRIAAYMLAGLFAGFGGIALTAFMGSGDATSGSTYMLMCVAGACIGGASLAGGRGMMIGSLIGALDIYFIQKLLSVTKVSSNWFQVAYGVILVGALVVNAVINKRKSVSKAGE